MRANGEGSVYRRGSGYEAAVTYEGKRRTARAATPTEARAKLRELLRRAEEHQFVQDERLTVEKYLEYWLSVVETTVRPSTHKRYGEYVRVHAVPVIGRHRLRELRPVHLQQLYAARLKAGASPSTVAHLHAALHRALAMAERWEYVTRNVARQVTPPSVPRFQLKPLTPAETQRLFTAAGESRYEAAVYLAVLTGLRLGEVFALRWADLDLGDEPVVRVRGSVQRVKGQLTVLEPKTRESVRDVALGRLGAEALRRHRARQAEERLRAGTSWEDGDLVFPNVWGRFTPPDYFVRQEFRRIVERAALPPMRFHDLRHTFATLQLNGKQPLKIVSEMMGHTRVGITQDLYTHVSAQMQRGAAAALDALLTPDDESAQGGRATPS
jgi:integrase